VPITEPSLGLLIANGYQYMLSGKYWISFYPGIALLVTIMTSAALDPDRYGVEGLIRGVNISFMVTGALSAIGIVLAFFMKNPKAQEQSEG
jgi:hypothetical protein